MQRLDEPGRSSRVSGEILHQGRIFVTSRSAPTGRDLVEKPVEKNRVSENSHVSYASGMKDKVSVPDNSSIRTEKLRRAFWIGDECSAYCFDKLILDERRRNIQA
jgi:hypothetical protein